MIRSVLDWGPGQWAWVCIAVVVAWFFVIVLVRMLFRDADRKVGELSYFISVLPSWVSRNASPRERSADPRSRRFLVGPGRRR